MEKCLSFMLGHVLVTKLRKGWKHTCSAANGYELQRKVSHGLATQDFEDGAEERAVTLPTVTVATVVFNGATEIARTIDSVLAQDYPNLEYVVIDGNSSDGTQTIVAGYGDAIDLFVTEPDQGIYDGMNKAITRASGEYILFMNSGDVFASPDALSCLAQATRRGVEQVLYGGWIRDDMQGRKTEHRPNLPKGLFNHQAVLYSRSLHAKFGDYVNVRDFTTADYFFFAIAMTNKSVSCNVVDKAVAVIDTGGISAGLQTLSQKYAIDYLCGRTSRYKLAAVLLLHPLYHRVKSVLRMLK